MLGTDKYVSIMKPPRPPFPICVKRWFQRAFGIQTSNLIFESDVGLMKPTTRQEAGRSVNGNPSSVVNDPSGIDCAVVIVVSGKDNDFRLSQLTAACAVPTAPQPTIANSVVRAIPIVLGLSLRDACVRIFIFSLLVVLLGFDKPRCDGAVL